jgi:hypothetical protein
MAGISFPPQLAIETSVQLIDKQPDPIEVGLR